MIMLIAKNTLMEGKQKEFTELAEKLVLATRKEAGCIAYDLVADQADACVYYISGHEGTGGTSCNSAFSEHRTSVWSAADKAFRGFHL